jgi:hypothetical protein
MNRTNLRTVPAALLIALVFLSALSACGSDGRESDDTTVDTTARTTDDGTVETTGTQALDPSSTVIEYHFGDSSVPPEYHRSYTLTVRKGEARLVVDSYGDVLHDVSRSIGKRSWTALLEGVADLESTTLEEESGCSGGTSRSLEVDDGETFVRIDIGLCDGDHEPEAAALDSLLEPVLDEFDMSSIPR